MPEVSKIERKGITYYIKDAVAREMLKQKYVMPNTGIPKQDLSEEVRILLNAAKTALQHYTETDPTVPNWAKQLHKPSYTAGEIEGLSIVAKTGSYNDLLNKPQIPDSYDDSSIMNRLSALENAGYITNEVDPTVPAWAKSVNKPSYTALEVGALPASTVIPTKFSDLTNDMGFISDYTETDPTVPAFIKSITQQDITNWNNKTNNVGTITGITMNGVNKGTSGIVDLGTVLTQHQSLAGYATTQYVDNTINDLIGQAPDVLDTLGEIAAALNDDLNFAATIATQLSAKANSEDVYIKSEVDTKTAKTTARADNKLLYNGQSVDTTIDNIGFSTTNNLLNTTGHYLAIRANNSNPFFGLKEGNNLWYAQAASNYFYFGPTSAKAMRLDQAGNVVVQTGSITANSIIKKDGTASQFLKADGSVDSNVYLTSHLDISGKANISDLAAVATSGSYNDLTDKPTVPSAYNDTALSNRITALENAGFLTSETDPSVPSWAKQSTKPTYTASEVGALPSSTHIPADPVNADWNATSGLAKILNKPTIPTVPTNVSAFTNDAGYLTSFAESDPTVPAWAKAATKPSYTASEVGALPDTTVIPTSTSQLTNDSGFLTSHQDISGKQDVLTAGDGIAIDNTDTIRTTGIPFGRCDSTSTATAFTATVPGIYKLEDGVCCMIENGVVTSASGFTLNVNNLGGKPCYSNLAAATRDTTIFNVAYTMLFVYDEERVAGGCWVCYRGYDANTNTIGYQVRSNSYSLPASQKFYRYRLLFTSADGTHYVPANTSTSTNATASRTVNQTPIDPFGHIVYYGTTAAVEANARPSASALWIIYTLSLGYSFNRTGAALTLDDWAPVYIKCAPQANGSAIIDADTPYVQALPTTNDGKIYIFLGVAYNATSIELLNNHPVYYHDGTGIRLWTGSTGGGSTDLSNYYTKTEVDTALSGKQATLVSGTNLKTVNSTSLLGSGNVSVQPTLVSGTNIKTINNESLLGSGNISIQGGGGSANIEYNSSKTALVIGGGSTKYSITINNPDNTSCNVTLNDFRYSEGNFPLQVNSGDILNVTVGAYSLEGPATVTVTMGGNTVSTSKTFTISSVSGNIVISIAQSSGGDIPIVPT